SGDDRRGFRPRPAKREIQWGFLFELPDEGKPMQFARSIDTLLAHGLGHLPASIASDPPPSLAERNLRRGKALGLPCGQDVARAMGVPADLILGKANKFKIGTGYKADDGTADP